jgi:hypothetical protein
MGWKALMLPLSISRHRDYVNCGIAPDPASNKLFQPKQLCVIRPLARRRGPHYGAATFATNFPSPAP